MLLFVLLLTSFGIVNAQTRVITGTVLDEQKLPLIQASVRVLSETAKGTVTDLDGHYSIEAQTGDVIEFAYLGYITKTVKLENQTTIDVSLNPDTESLQGTVVTALGIKRSQKALSYSVQEIKSDELTTVKDANFMNALSGKVAGVNINASSSGIGGATRVVMRGPKSMNQSNQALYVIDGVPMFNVNGGGAASIYAVQPRGEGISDINPDDIASISVLSGPAAAALYGASAAQGVIMVTTKKGKEGKASVSISNSTSFSNPFIMPEFQNEYVNNPGETQSWGPKQESAYGKFNPKKFFRTGYNIQNTAALTVGNDKNQTYLSLGTTNAEGIIPNSEYNRYNFTFRNTTKFFEEKFTLDFGFNYIKQKDQNLMAQGQYFNPLLALYLFPRGESFESIRTFEIYDPIRKINVQNWQFGDAYKMQNPYWIAKRMNRTSQKDRYMTNVSLKYQIFEWLNFTGRARMDLTKNFYQDKRHASTIDLFAHSPYGFYQYENATEKAVYADFMANINKDFLEDFNVSANLGVSTNRTSSKVYGFQGGLKKPSNVFTPNNIDYGFATNDNRPEFMDHSHVTNAAFANVELSWKRLVYLTITGRSDWDSALSNTTSNPFFYPSVGLAGIISDMVELPSWFDFLKARVSWAKVGSPIPTMISSDSRYQYDPASQTYKPDTYKFPENFKPELTYSWEAGIQAKFFENRISVDATFYNSNTKNQTFLRPITSSEGYSSEYIQAGNIRNRGLELAVGFHNSWNDFDWNSTITYSFNRNKIVSLLDGKPLSKGGLSGLNVYLKEGGNMGDYYVNKTLRRDPEGNVSLDSKGNLEIQTLDTPKYVGSALPKGNLGWLNDFSYKGINFGFMISARLGGIVMSQTQAVLDSYGVSARSAEARDNGGVAINKGFISAQKYYSVVGGDTPIWDDYIYSATNVRLQEAHVSYTLPTKWFKDKAKLTLGVTARNLFMIYNKAPFDPELTASTGTYYQGVDYFMQPSLRNIGFNVKLQF